jgi:hypothetical protein
VQINMLTTRAIVILLGIAPLFAGVSAASAESTCASLENKDSQTRLKFLQGEKARLDGNCVLYAIDRLRVAQYAPAAATVIRYLDYPYPPPKNFGTPENPVFVLQQLNWTNYAAANALSDIGKAVVPQLVDVIADAATSDLVRQNAADTIMAIYNHLPEGIAVLVRAAHARTDPMDSNRLMDQARRLPSRCGREVRNDCENAVLK